MQEIIFFLSCCGRVFTRSPTKLNKTREFIRYFSVFVLRLAFRSIYIHPFLPEYIECFFLITMHNVYHKKRRSSSQVHRADSVTPGVEEENEEERSNQIQNDSSPTNNVYNRGNQSATCNHRTKTNLLSETCSYDGY